MANGSAKAWRCLLCGYIHHGEAPPDNCPVCGASREDFAPYEEEPAKAPQPAAEQWRCVNCGYVHKGGQPPDACPVCGAVREDFEPVGEGAEKVTGRAGLKRAVVVGAGVAGVSAAESLRQAAPEAEITLLSKESELPYYRLNLTRYLAGEIGADELPLHAADWYEQNKIQLMSDAEVTGIAPDEHQVKLCDGESLSYDKLILTAGSHPFVPPLPGATREGVTRFRSLTDADRIIEAAKSGAKCVCVGGGILGLETAGGLARRGADVTLLEGHGWLLPRQLNEAAGRALERHVETMGITLCKQARVDEIQGDEHVRGVLLKSGDTLDADFVVIATGVRPNSYLARMAGLEVNQGILVDNHLCTSHPNVLAAGDIAEHRGVVYGLWQPAQFMGSIAGLNAGGVTSEFGGIPRSNVLKVLGISLFSIGEFDPRDASYEAYDDDGDDGYFRFVFRDSHLVGAILLGDTSLTAVVKNAVETRVDFGGLLRERPNGKEVRARLSERA